MLDNKTKPLIALLGPTATGKTRLAALLAAQFDGEVISADSRQVYRGMNLGTGKDYDDYLVGGHMIQYHLVDIAEPGTEYSLFSFVRDFIEAFNTITHQGKIPVVCGGTGLYLDAVLKGYQMAHVPEQTPIRSELEKKSNSQLAQMLSSYRPLHNTTDLTNRIRLLRAVEIAEYRRKHPEAALTMPVFSCRVFGINCSRLEVRTRITSRLQHRIKQGMIEEVSDLLQQGLTPDQLDFYGLEYRYITRYLSGAISYDQMFESLNTAIHQFAKRQMTWFRKMERSGIPIDWIDGSLPQEERLKAIMSRL